MVEIRTSVIFGCVLIFTVATQTLHAEKTGNGKSEQHKGRFALMKIPGSMKYIPVLIHNLATAATENSYQYKLPGHDGYSYPRPATVTRNRPARPQPRPEYIPDDEGVLNPGGSKPRTRPAQPQKFPEYIPDPDENEEVVSPDGAKPRTRPAQPQTFPEYIPDVRETNVNPGGSKPRTRPAPASRPKIPEYVPIQDDRELDRNPGGSRYPQYKQYTPIVDENEEDIQAAGVNPDIFPPTSGVYDAPGFDACAAGPTLSCLYGDTISGTPGVDYPTYAEIPTTGFKCPSMSGYYGDTQTRCQAFHVCMKTQEGRVRQYSFLCPNGTVFSQNDYSCVGWSSYNCDATPSLYHLNNQLRWEDTTVSLIHKMDYLKKMSDKTKGEILINPLNFPQQILPALSIRLPDSRHSFGILQKISLPPTPQVPQKVRPAKYTPSVSYEDKDNGGGLIVNRPRGPTKTTPRPYVIIQTTEPFPDKEMPDIVNSEVDEQEEDIQSAGSLPTTTTPAPRKTAKPTTTPAPQKVIPSRKPKTTARPRTTTTQAPPEETPEAEIGFNVPEEEESDLEPDGQPEFEVTTKAPITKLRPPPALTYPHQKKYSYQQQKQQQNEENYNPSYGAPAFLSPSTSNFGIGYDQSYTIPFTSEGRLPYGTLAQAEKQYDGTALFFSRGAGLAPARAPVIFFQTDVLQNPAVPEYGQRVQTVAQNFLSGQTPLSSSYQLPVVQPYFQVPQPAPFRLEDEFDSYKAKRQSRQKQDDAMMTSASSPSGSLVTENSAKEPVSLTPETVMENEIIGKEAPATTSQGETTLSSTLKPNPTQNPVSYKRFTERGMDAADAIIAEVLRKFPATTET